MKYIKAFENDQDYVNNKLLFSIRNNDVADVILYINNGADKNLITNDGRVALVYAIDYNRGEEYLGVIKELIKRNVNINIADDAGLTPLHHALYKENINIIKLLIENNVELNNIDKNGRTPLIMVAEYNRIETAYLLIDAGADWNIANNNNETFLEIFPEKNREKIINKYPDMYKKYLMIENTKKFNL